MKWDPSQAAWIKPHLEKFDKPIREKLHRHYQWYEEIAMPVLGELRRSVNYNNANDYNILVTGAANHPEIAGVIDFGDSVFTNTINELAIAIAYLAMNKPDPLAAASAVVSGFHRVFPITEKELNSFGTKQKKMHFTVGFHLSGVVIILLLPLLFSVIGIAS